VGPQEDQHHERRTGDQGGHAGDDQVLSEQPEPLGDENREQRRAIIAPLSNPQLSLGQPGLGGKEVIKLLELGHMLQMRQPDREREAPQDGQRKPGTAGLLCDATPSEASDDGMTRRLI
jgi:hypothetical protein